MPLRTAASYNSLIAACAHGGRAIEALALLPRMLAAGLRPTCFTFAPLLSAPSLGLHEGVRIHSVILKSGFLHADPFSGTALLGLYARNGRLDEAFRLFEDMPIKNAVTWNSIISALSWRGFVDDSMFLFRQLLGTGIAPTECSFLSILPALCSSESSRSAEQIHGLAFKTAMDSFPVVANALLQALSTCSGVHAAERLFNSLHIRDVVSWNTMIAAFAKSGIPERALELFFLMMYANEIFPSEATITSAISACTGMGSAECGVLIHAKAIKCNLNNVFVASSLIEFYASLKRPAAAHRVFDELPEKNAACWNALISGYSRNDPHHSFILLKSMLESENRPNELSFSSLLKQATSSSELQQLHSLIIRMGYCNNEYISSALIASYDFHGILSDASSCIESVNSVASTAEMNAMASIYNRAGRHREAQELLFQVQSPDTMSWNILLNACARNRGYSDALLLFKHMQSSSGLSFDNYTAVSLVSICTKIDSLTLGRSIHGLIVKTISGCLDTFVCNMLLDMYAKCGSLDGCLKVFQEMGERRNLISWTALITGLGLHGHPHDAIARFRQMESEGFEPDRVTLIAVLSACRHGGLVEEGMHLFERMRSDYGIEPEMDHYVCVVDLLCRYGHLKEAELVISGMPFQPNAVIWRTFLQGCKRFGGLLS